MSNQTDFEVIMRRIMCILLGVETLCICFFLLIMSDDELTIMQLKYHEVTLLNTIKASRCLLLPCDGVYCFVSKIQNSISDI